MAKRGCWWVVVAVLATGCGGSTSAGDAGGDPSGSEGVVEAIEAAPDAADPGARDPAAEALPADVAADPPEDPASGDLPVEATTDVAGDPAPETPAAEVDVAAAEGSADLPGEPAADLAQADPGAGDADAGGETVPGSKAVGEFCTINDDCADGRYCVKGQFTPAHCNPKCTSNADCNAGGTGLNGQCMLQTSQGNFCMYYCGMMGGTCPGQLYCDGAACD